MELLAAHFADMRDYRRGKVKVREKLMDSITRRFMMSGQARSRSVATRELNEIPVNVT